MLDCFGIGIRKLYQKHETKGFYEEALERPAGVVASSVWWAAPSCDGVTAGDFFHVLDGDELHRQDVPDVV
jgi:hypothetical protein